MTSFQQMGHRSQNLLGEPELCGFGGAIISPVNYSEADTTGQIAQYRSAAFKFVFDPQLYLPSSQRVTLREWPYFPSDFDTADRDSRESWTGLLRNISKSAETVGADLVCSPAAVPKIYSNEYFEMTVQVGDELASIAGDKFVPVQTVLVSMAGIAEPTRALKVASLVSATRCPWIYLVLDTNQEPRRELLESDELLGVMTLVSALESSGLPVLVGYSGSEVVLWKAAGASAAATGKFFNVRRFTPARFEPPPAAGGGALPYWFDEGLMAFLREGDLIRLDREDLLSDASRRSPYFASVMDAIKTGRPWIGLGWRQYMCWFADMERRIAVGDVNVKTLLGEADAKWGLLDEREIFMEDRQNDGAWVRKWRQALADFGRSRT